MLLYIYLGITALLLIFIVRYMVKEKKLLAQIDAALVLVPLLLRLFLIK